MVKTIARAVWRIYVSVNWAEVLVESWGHLEMWVFRRPAEACQGRDSPVLARLNQIDIHVDILTEHQSMNGLPWWGVATVVRDTGV